MHNLLVIQAKFSKKQTVTQFPNLKLTCQGHIIYYFEDFSQRLLNVAYKLAALFSKHLVQFLSIQNSCLKKPSYWLHPICFCPLYLHSPCGSIMRGHLLVLLTIIPLSTENESTGSPAICHSRIFTGSPSVWLSEKLLEHGILTVWHNCTHSDMHSYNLDINNISTGV